MSGGPHEIEIKLRFDDEAAHERLRQRLDPSGTVRPVRQVNHFFDTPERRLRAHSIGLRLRQEIDEDERERWFLTAKGPKGGIGVQREGGGEVALLTALSVRREEEIEIGPDEAAGILAGRRAALDVLHEHEHHREPLLASPPGAHEQTRRRAFARAILDVLDGATPVRVGAFENVRHRLPLVLEVSGSRFVGEAELDRTTFPGGIVHHELELEVPDTLDHDEVEARLADLLASVGTVGRPSRGKASRFFDALAGLPI